MDHVTIYVADLAAGSAFWSELLAPLDWQLAAAEPTRAVHLAFKARGPEEDPRFHATGLALGCRDHGGPGLRPHYGADDDAAFVLDALGNNLEAVHGAP